MIRTFENVTIGKLTLRNRVVMPPMCMYQSKDGFANNFHLMHYGHAALGGTGLIIQEATAVDPAGRITDDDLGLWDEKFVPKLAEIVEFVHGFGAKMGIQLGHAGRKAQVSEGQVVGPTTEAFSKDYKEPKELTKQEISEIVEKFGKSAALAEQAGYDLVEIHAAHGYLLHQFLTPLINTRTDEYGGISENRSRFLKEVIDAVRANFSGTLSVRISATDWMEGGLEIDYIIDILRPLVDDIDIVHVSSGGAVIAQKVPLYPGYQVDFADTISGELKIPVIAVGLITTLGHAEEIIRNGRADLVALGRELLRSPNWVLNNLYEYDQEFSGFPKCIERAYKRDKMYK